MDHRSPETGQPCRRITPQSFALWVLGATLLVGIGVTYSRKHSPFFLHVTPPLEELTKLEEAFERSKEVSLRNGGIEDFERLPHVGPKLARRIVAYRDLHGFQKKEDILNVQGIGAETYEKVKDLLILE